MIQEYLDKNVTVIIRTVGERTTNLCYDLIKKQIDEDNIHIISETPFTEAVRKTFEVGLQQNRKWTFVVDADVLVKPGIIEQMVEYVETVDENYFEIEGKIIDKFLVSPREAGNHLYRTSLMKKALEFIPQPREDIRPETFVKNKMREAGFDWQVITVIMGLHDFEQSYKDIYRKSFVQAKKHTEKVRNMLVQWNKLAETDYDFKVAVHGFSNGEEYSRSISIDANCIYSNLNPKDLKYLKIYEKKNLNVADFNEILWNVIKTQGSYLQIKQNLLSQKEKEIHAYNKEMIEKNKIISQKEKIIEEKDSSIKYIQNSYSYRIGKVFTFPIRLLIKGYKRIGNGNFKKNH